jgi:hypothetical protein
MAPRQHIKSLGPHHSWRAGNERTKHTASTPRVAIPTVPNRTTQVLPAVTVHAGRCLTIPVIIARADRAEELLTLLAG